MAKIPSGSPSEENKLPLPDLSTVMQVPDASGAGVKLISTNKLPFDPAAICGHASGINAMSEMLRAQLLALRIEMERFAACPETLEFVISDLTTALARFRMISARICGSGADETRPPQS